MPVPVLMYHHVAPRPGDLVTVTPEVFEGQMRHLAEQGIRTLTLDELMDYQAGTLRLEGKAVVITFDDAWLDNLVYAYPILLKYRLKATIFVVTGWSENASLDPPAEVGTDIPRHGESKQLATGPQAHRVVLGWEQMKQMMASGLIEFHSHTVTHPKCGEIDGETLREELVASRETMAARLGKETRYLCWPYGSHSDAAVAQARAAGYCALFTTLPGVASKGGDPLHIKRIVVKDKVDWFKARVRTYTSPLRAALYLALKKGK